MRTTSMVALDVSRWNLGRSFAPAALLIGGCGPVVVTPGQSSDTDDTTTDSHDTEPTPDTDSDTDPTPNTTAGCGDCPSGYYCAGDACVPYGCEDGPCCYDTGGCCGYYDGGCYYGDCNSVSDCGPGLFCSAGFEWGGYCQDVAQLPACASPTPSQILFSADAEVISLAFFDADGDLGRDLAVATKANVWVLDAAEAAAGPELLPPGQVVVDVAAGDLDGDGDQDLAVARAGDAGIATLLNDGTGAFTPGPDVALAASEIAIADLDADGNADVIALAELGGPTAVLAVAFAADGGGFGPPNVLESGGTTYGFTLGDADGSGAIDIAAHQDYGTRVWYGGSPFDGSVEAYYWSDVIDELAPGPLTFAPTLSGSSQLARALTWSGTTLVDVWTNSSTFDAIRFGFPDAYAQLVAADLDGNGDASLVFARAGALAVVSETFDCASTIELDLSSADALAQGDFTGDGAADIAVASGTNIMVLSGL